MFETVQSAPLRAFFRRVSASQRQARAAKVLAIIQSVATEKGGVRILDLGGTAAYWSLFDRDALGAWGVHITLVNPRGERDETTPPPEDPLFTHIFGDARHLPEFADHSFDLVHSNSVIEHVGGWPDKVAFAREVRRLAPAYFVQTPYQWFPVEPHWVAPFIHWLPEHGRAKWLMLTRKGLRHDYDAAMRRVEGARLLDRTQMRHLFSDARLLNERFLGLTKSVMAVRAPERAS